MGSLFKHQSVRWVDSDGRRVIRETPGAVKKTESSSKWWGKYRDAGGKLKTVSLCVDKQNAKHLLVQLERKEERRKVGLSDNHTEQAVRPLSEHIADWLAALREGHASERRVEDMERRINKLVAIGKWDRLSEVTEDSLRSALSKLEVSAQTWNHYLQHIRQFIRCCVPDRLAFNPISKLKRRNVNTDRRHDRRALTLEEQASLISTTEASTKIRFNLDGPSRGLLYRLAFATGFRRNELQSLTRESFDLESELPCVTVAAAYSKHRRQDQQPLPQWIIETLRKHFASGGQLWPGLTKHTSKMFKADLEAAGIQYVTQGADGKLYADFHATRHTFVTAISRTIAPLKDMMEMTRHESSDLFLKTYAKTNQSNKADVARQLVDPCLNSPKVA
jgi:integrase